MPSRHMLPPQPRLPGTMEAGVERLLLRPENREQNRKPSSRGTTGRLYCRNGGHHLRIQADGAVDGSRKENDINTVVTVKAVSAGVVVIKGSETGRYLAMNQNGQLYGSKTLSEECHFMEKLEENHYNTYRSQKYGNGHWYVGLRKDGRPKLGGNTDMGQNSVYFLPRPVEDSTML
ncbi:fibroblast growth factor 1b isoform X2 [Denticeps clupeoides]|uniref:Fibroblast growth factor n=1 Tax=Denticeps clupeoides TaxID=299321 RepID=A0AAY4ELL8_9TELE|nr:fibroblast growth factor 1 isoform X2 [Denticeps clupeoides]